MTRRALFAVLLLLPLLLALRGRSPLRGRSDPLERGQILMAAGSWREAAAVLAMVGGDPRTQGHVLESRLLRVRALARDARGAEAVALAERILGEIGPEHPSRDRARALLSEALDASGLAAEAVTQLSKVVARALGEAHLSRVAGVWFALAEKVARGEDSKDPLHPGRRPDPKKAAKLYRKGLGILRAGRPWAEVSLPLARCLLAAGKGRAGAGVLSALLKEAKGEEAWVLEARLLRARCLIASGNGAGARESLRRLGSISGGELAPQVEDLVAQSWLLSGDSAGKLRAAAVWRQSLKRWPRQKRGAELRLLVACSLADAGAPKKALDAFRVVLSDQGQGAKALAEAQRRVAEILEALGRFDDSRTAWRSFLAVHPDDPQAPMAVEQLRTSWIRQASRLSAAKKWRAAAAALENFIAADPLSLQAPLKTLEVARNLRRAGDIDACLAKLKGAAQRYLRHNPAVAAQARLLFAIVLEEERSDLPAAIQALREVLALAPRGNAARAARSRLAVLESVVVSAQVSRRFFPGEEAFVELSTRNVSEYRVRLFRLNAGEVFEERGRLQGASATEVSLVKADLSSLRRVPDYQPYRHYDLKIPLSSLQGGRPLSEGLWLVSVETGERRSVVTLLVSGIDVVVKSYPGGLFCWVVDAKSGEPRPGAKVLVRSAGFRVDRVSDAEGIVRIEGVPRAAWRVMALKGSSFAVVEGAGVQTSTERPLAAKIVLNFDRPFYPPGALVRFQAFIREPEGGEYRAPKSALVTLSLKDSAGSVVGETTAESTSFGSIHSSFQLPKNARLGVYHLQLSFHGHRFVREFDVSVRRRAEIQVALSSKEEVLEPGARLEVSVALRRFSGGAPPQLPFEWGLWRRRLDRDQALRAIAAGAEGRGHRLPDPGGLSGFRWVRQGEGRTDAEGRAQLQITAPKDAGSWEYLIQATVPDAAGLPQAGSLRFAVSEIDRFALLKLRKRSWEITESVELRIATPSLLGTPLRTRGRLIAERNTTPKWTPSWKAVWESAVDTGIDGECRLKIKLPRPGRYRLRFLAAEGSSRAIETSAEIVVIGESAQPMFSIDFERPEMLAGETARVHLQTLEAGRPVLITFEGAGILSHRILRPEKRHQVFELPILGEMAPNVTVAATLVLRGKIHQDRKRIEIEERLEVSVHPEKAELRPGEKLGVVVETKDQLGRPVAAAVMLKVVDDALNAVATRSEDDPRRIFALSPRPHGVKTVSSIGFSCRGVDQVFDAALVELRSARARREAMEADKEEEWQETEGEERSPRGAVVNDTIGLGGGSGGALGGRGGGVRRMRTGGGGRRRMDLATEAIDDHNESEDWEEGPRPRTRRRFLAVAGWWPELVVGPEGRTRIVLELPDNLTRWKLSGAAGGRGRLLGRGHAFLRARKTIALRLIRPRFLNSVDRIRLPALVSTDLDAAVLSPCRLGVRSLTPSILEGKGMTRYTFASPKEGMALRYFDFDARSAGQAVLAADLSSGGVGDALETSLRVRPFGEPLRQDHELSLQASGAIDFRLEKTIIPGTRRMRLSVGLGLNAEFLGIAERMGRMRALSCEDRAHAFIAAAIAYRSSGPPSPLREQRMHRRAAEALSSFIPNEIPGRGYGKWPGEQRVDPKTTTAVIDAFWWAGEIGCEVPTAWLRSAAGGGRKLLDDRSLRPDLGTRLLRSLARMGVPATSPYLRLLRQRSRLWPEDLAQLALAAKSLGRRTEFDDLSRQLAAAVPGPKRRPGSRLKERAAELLVLDLSGAYPLKALALAKSIRGSWGRGRESLAGLALALEALAARRSAEIDRLSATRVELTLDGKKFQTVELDGATPRRSLDLPADLASGAHRLGIVPRGAGELKLRLSVEALAPAERIASSSRGLVVTRTLIPFESAVEQRSEDLLMPRSRDEKQRVPSVRQLALGDHLRVELRVRATRSVRDLLIVDPQLAGLSAELEGVKGKPKRVERHADRLVFACSGLVAGETLTISYPCTATFAGHFSALPAQAEDRSAPDWRGRSDSLHLEIVEDRSQLAATGPRKLTHSERWRDAGSAFEKGRFADSLRLALPLLVLDLRPSYQRRILALVLRSALSVESWSDAVEAYDQLEIKWPGETKLSVREKESLGRALLASGRLEDARGLFLAVLRSAMEVEMEFADPLAACQGADARVDFIEETLKRYPPGLEAAARLRLLDLKVAAAWTPTRETQALAQSLAIMAWYSGEAAARTAARQRLRLLTASKNHEAAALAAAAFVSRFPKAKESAEVQVIGARALFAQARYESAAALASKVWEASPAQDRGARFEAGYLLGQIAHMRGKLKEALHYYKAVESVVNDAKQSRLFFTAQQLSLDAVTRIAVGQKACIPFRARNAETLRFSVYPVDLPVLFAVRKGFSSFAPSELAGISPLERKDINCAFPPYTTGQAQVDFGPLPEGAYIVTARAGALGRGSLLLVSGLKIEVQRSEGRLRVWCHQANGRPAPKVELQLVRHRNLFATGRSDARGILSVEDPGPGKVLVVASQGAACAVAECH